MPPASLRALIVDDEPIARRVLREELELIGGVEVVCEARDGAEALERIRAAQPDLVFLDLQMPGMGGFEVVRRLTGGKLPVVVIVTAYDQYAIQAFEAGAIDYLLKPVSQERLQRSVQRARHLSGRGAGAAEQVLRIQNAAPDPAARPRRVVGKAGDEYFLVDAGEVVAFQAEGDLVWMMAGRRRYLVTDPLRELERKLADLGFRRVHRNALVNLNQVAKMAALSSRRWLLTMSSGQEYVVSKRQAALVRDLLGR